MILLGFFLLTCSRASAQQLGFGSCPNVQPIPNFDVTQYAGDWYEIQKYNTIPELFGKCITATYTPNPDGSIKVFNQQINTITKKPSSIEGRATLAGKQNEGLLSVKFPGIKPAPLLVLDTDYLTYAVVYSCNDIRFLNGKGVWILSKQREISPIVRENALKVLDRNNLSRKPLKKTDQKKCPFISRKHH